MSKQLHKEKSMKKLLAVLIAVLIVAPAFAHWSKNEHVEHWPDPIEAPVPDETKSVSPATSENKTLKKNITDAVVKASDNQALSLWYSNVKKPLQEKGCKFVDDQDMLQRLGSVERYYQTLKKDTKQKQEVVWATGAEIATPFKCKDGATFSTPDFLAENKLDDNKFNEDMAAWRVNLLSDQVNYTHYKAMEKLKKEVKAHSEYAKAKDAYMAWEARWEKARITMAEKAVADGICDGSHAGICQECLSDVSGELDAMREKYYELQKVSAPIAKVVKDFLKEDKFTTKNNQKTITVYTIRSYFDANETCMHWPIEDENFLDRMYRWVRELSN